MIEIKDNLKDYGKDTELWYYSHQGEQFPLALETKKGYLVSREEMPGTKLYLVKFKHAEEHFDELDDEMV